MKYDFISRNQEHYTVEQMCSSLEVSRSGYYQWKSRDASARELEERTIKESISKIHSRSKGRYGYRPVHAHLREQGVDCGRDRALRLMRQMGILGDRSPRYKPMGTDSDHNYGYSANLLKRKDQSTGKWIRKKPQGCDEVWVADTTYLKIEGSWMYLATVMDLFSRRIVGWSVSASNDAELVCQALLAASMTRGELKRGIIHHSDRGSAYACNRYRALLQKLGMASSMSAKGNCYDNAAMESFYGRFKVSSIGDKVFENEQELRAAIFEYVEPYYNRYRKHSSLGYKSPIQFEEIFLPPMGGNEQEDAFTDN
ncbi:IS3 family transposase [Puniceicoccaceae bacterium K14]|nr:IS3 family transposase [Puniceicoccaceae bacterium K14]